MNSPNSILISNRGPDFVVGDTVHYSQGGTSDAYRALATRLCDRWLCLCPASLGLAPIVSDLGDKLDVLFIEEHEYQRYYHRFVSQYLYPVLLNCPEQAVSLANYDDYLRVCNLITSALRRHLPGRLLLCDYHLFRIPLLVDWPCQKIYFWFIPFLDIAHHSPIHKDIVDSLSRCDLVFFYIDEYVENFLKALQYYYPGRPVTCKPISLVSGPGRAFLDTSSISIRNYADALHRYFNVRYSSKCTYCLSVSRLDFVKNIPLVVQGFESYLKMKDSEAPAHLLIVAPHHRKDSVVYIAEQERIHDVISRSPFSKSISISHRRFSRQELKILYKYSDVMVVGSRFDGMPITALEYALSNRGNGAIVTSNTTGTSAFLGEDVYDFVSGQPDDLGRALLAATSASDVVRRHKMSHAKLVVQEVTVDRWLTRVERILDNVTATECVNGVETRAKEI